MARARNSQNPERSMNIHMQPGMPTPTHSACTARKPSVDRAEIIARTVEVHIRNGNWAMAHNSLTHAESEFARTARTPEEWLDAALYEFALPHRAISVLEAAGILTMREALTFLNTGAVLQHFGPGHGEDVWRAARGKGIDFERSVVASFAAARKRQYDIAQAKCKKKKREAERKQLLEAE